MASRKHTDFIHLIDRFGDNEHVPTLPKYSWEEWAQKGDRSL